MKYLFSCLFSLFILCASSQDLIKNFEVQSDSLKNEKVAALLKENRGTDSFENRISRIKDIAQFCKLHGHLPTESLAISNLCIAYVEVGKFDEANEISARIDSSYFEHLKPKDQLMLNLYRSQPLVSQGKLDETVELAQSTLTICEQNDLPKNNVYGLLSTVYTSLGKFKDALEMDRSNLTDILKNHPETKRALGQVYYSLSRDFTNLNRLDSANYYGIKSLSHWTHPISLVQLGDIKTRLSEYDSARVYLSKAETIIQSSPAWKNMETSLYLYLSQLEIKEKNWVAGFNYSEKALETARLENDLEVSQKAYENIIRSLLKDKEYYLDSFLVQDTTLRNQKVASMAIEMDTKYRASEKEKEILKLNNSIQQQEIQTLRFRNYLLYAGVIAIILFALLFLLFRIRKFKNNQEIKRLRKQALQLQMNPHFFFNSLNSIHNFIANNNTNEAQKYLINFSKLMRLTLENSQENLVPIQKEVEFLNNFLILEKLRNKNFDFDIEVSNELLSHKIPSFLIQPLIENSLLHGFLKINYEGIVKLKIEKIDDSMLVTVTDNGIGWAKSIELKQENSEHHSFGIEILKKRISLYTKKANTISIENGIAESENFGTKASFQLPLFN